MVASYLILNILILINKFHAIYYIYHKEHDAIPQTIDVKVEKFKRINVMMRSDILEVLPERLVEFNSNRSAYLQALVLQDLQTHNIATL